MERPSERGLDRESFPPRQLHTRAGRAHTTDNHHPSRDVCALLPTHTCLHPGPPQRQEAKGESLPSGQPHVQGEPVSLLGWLLCKGGGYMEHREENDGAPHTALPCPCPWGGQASALAPQDFADRGAASARRNIPYFSHLLA